MDDDTIDDPTSITGIAGLLNYRGDQDVVRLEKEITGGHVTSVPDALDEFKRQLEQLTNMGISLDADSPDDADADADEKDADEPANYPKTFERLTEEQRKQGVLSKAFGNEINNMAFSVEKEKEEDDKTRMLEEIDSLIINLKDDGVDVSRVPAVDATSSITDIRNTHRILRLKNDRKRYTAFAEEGIMAAAYGVEWMFDGKKSYAGRKPNMEGWSSTVNVKLRRMRYDTSTFVSEIMRDFDMGPGMRILCELLPSGLLFGRMKMSNHRTLTDSDVALATDKMRAHLG